MSGPAGLRVLGIETSCDETAAAIVEDGRRILSNVVASQVDIHAAYGGVVPELASRHHIEAIAPVVEAAMAEAQTRFEELAAVAVTQGPGLVGSLLVGLQAAKAIALVHGKPLVPVHHVAGHVAAAFLAKPDWWAALAASVLPTFRWDALFIATLVGVLGTTISPYLFFWQASQEVEEEKAHGKRTATSRRGASDHELADARLDVTTGIALSNLVFYFIILATASTLHRAGIHEIETAREAAEALRPLAGDAAYFLFAAGLIGTGFLAVPVLAGSASFAVAELFGWRAGLDLSPRRGRRFYLVFAYAMLGGMLLDLVQMSPIRMLLLAAVLNGILAPPLLVLVMLVSNNANIMGERTNGPWLNILGWTATVLMTAAAVAFFVTSL